MPNADGCRQPARRGGHAAADDSPTSVLSDPLGPLWYRGLVARDAGCQGGARGAKPPAPRSTAEQELDAVLAAYGAKRLVIAPYAEPEGHPIAYGGRLARIDTGNSRYYGGPLSWLEIIGDQMTPHTVARTPCSEGVG